MQLRNKTGRHFPRVVIACDRGSSSHKTTAGGVIASSWQSLRPPERYGRSSSLPFSRCLVGVFPLILSLQLNCAKCPRNLIFLVRVSSSLHVTIVPGLDVFLDPVEVQPRELRD